MAGVQASVQLNDLMTAPLKNIINALESTINTFETLQNTAERSFNGVNFSNARSQIDLATKELEEMNSHINNAKNSQEQHNRSIQETTVSAGKLHSTIKNVAAAYITMQGAASAISLSDEMALTASKLDMMNDGLQTNAELQHMIYKAAQNSRGSYLDMSAAVAKLGMQTGDLFNSTAEIVDFQNILNKMFKVAGATQEETSNATLQLVQALGSGVLRGDELNSIFEQAPTIIQSIADYMGVSIGKIRELASEGKISAEVVKNAIFASSSSIDEQFNKLSMTWGDVATNIKNTAILAFEPVLTRINELANSEQFANFANNVINVMVVASNVIVGVFDFIAQLGSVIGQNWSVISPLIYAVLTLTALYNGVLFLNNTYQAVSNGLKTIAAVRAAAHGSATVAEAAATAGMTTAQMGLNAALYACPLTWILLLIIAVVGVIATVIALYNKWTNSHISAVGVICGGINVVIQFFKNLGIEVANVALGIWNSLSACATNMGVAFNNVICNIQAWFWDLLATVMETVEGVCSALNKIPFVEFDYQGVINAGQDYANKAAAARANKEEYESITEAFSEGMDTFEGFTDGWVGDAYNDGYNWGEGIVDKISDFVAPDMSKYEGIANSTYTPASAALSTGNIPTYDSLSPVATNTGKTASNTKDIKDALDITNEDLKYLRDFAEQEIINRFTTAEIKVDMSNYNTINNSADLDGITEVLKTALENEMQAVAEGVM